MRRDRDRLEREVEGLARQTIPSLDERAAYERRDGNHERAIELLRSFIDHDAAALGPHCRAIAEWHLSMVEGDPPSEHWTAAKRFATLPIHLEPGDRTATALLAEINARTGDAALRAGDIETTRRDWDEAWHWAPDSAGDSTLVDVLLERLPNVREEGDYFRYLALAQRAVALCQRTFGTGHEATRLASYHLPAGLMLCGRSPEALVSIDSLLPIVTDVSGERHPQTLSTMRLRGPVLRAVGEVEAALAANRAAHEGLVRAVGRQNPHTLYAAADLGMSLAATGDATTAETLLAATLAAQSEVLGGEHPDARRTAEALAAPRAQGAPVAAPTSQEEPTPSISQD